MNENTGKTVDKPEAVKSNSSGLVKWHWYCLSYFGESVEGHRNSTASIYVSMKYAIMPKRVIDQSKKPAGMKDGAALIGCSYLGEMDDTTFKTAT